MTNEYLHDVRDFELAQIISHFPSSPSSAHQIRVLDIGAGTDRQSLVLKAMGYEVVSIDLPTSAYASDRIYPVIDYNGMEIPLADTTMDVVFSSNVLEHVSDLQSFLRETRRVLAPGGVAIHILPTPAWRCWTAVTHYPWILKHMMRILFLNRRTPESHGCGTDAEFKLISRIRFLAWPARHGARGSMLSETHFFSEQWWRNAFFNAGFEVTKTFQVGLFYTGSMLFAERIPIPCRQRLAKWLGSACRVYIVQSRTVYNR